MRHKTYANLGDFLRECRHSVNMSQEEVALKLGYSERHFISRMENGRVSLPLNKIKDIAELYRIPLHDLVDAVIEEQNRLLRLRIKKAIGK
jgi:transcriptional regulator with XRE-family HTH domain